MNLRAVSTLVGLAAGAAAQTPPPQATHPDWRVLRQDEDWSKPRAGASSPLDAIKHVRLTADGRAWVSFGGRIDDRFEAWDGFGFGARAPGDRDTFNLFRMHLHADMHFGEHVRVYVEPRTAQSSDRDLPGGRRVTDVDTFGLYQGFLELSAPNGGAPVRLRLGRQSLLFGAQRVVSPDPWNNVLNSWDGASLHGTVLGFRTQTFATWFVPNNPTSLNFADRERAFYGVYATKDASKHDRGLDLYLLGARRPDARTQGTQGDERRHTLGARSFGPLGGPYDGEVEAALQTGEVGDERANGWFAAAALGRRLPDACGAPRVFGGGDVASGGARPGGHVGTYFQNYPLGHPYLGYADVVGRQNVLAAHLGASWSLAEATTLTVTGHALWLYDDADDLYAANGASTAPSIDPTGREIGQEIDVLLTHRFGRHLDVYAGWSHVFTGDGVKGPGVTGSDVDFVYVGTSFVF
ncbi:MAG: hypothetical protein FJ301_09955 [Planctomycetes bacterium]|nr:hypothetical protein [Planctomycetota bacterium]